MASAPAMLSSTLAPDGAPAPRVDWAPPAAVPLHGAVRSEPGTGGVHGECPRMVPRDEIATPQTEHIPPPGSVPYAAHGPLPPLHSLAYQPPANAAQQYPTPGVAYDPYNAMHSPYIQPPSPIYYGQRQDAEVAALTAQLHGALGEIGRLSALVSSSPHLPAPIQVPLARVNVHSARASQHSPSGLDECGSSFETITSSSYA